jgi:hypothetical protein
MSSAAARPVVVGPVQIGPLRSLLERFRRSAGMPAAVGADLGSELAPVFAALDDIEREVARLRARSEAAAAARLQEADEAAERILAEARQLAAKEREVELETVLQRTDAEAEAIVAQAAAAAEVTRKRGDERLPALVTEVLARVLQAER